MAGVRRFFGCTLRLFFSVERFLSVSCIESLEVLEMVSVWTMWCRCWIFTSAYLRIFSGNSREIASQAKNDSRRSITHDPIFKASYREEHSMDQCRSRPKLSENFERHWSILILGENSYGPIIGPYLFLGKFVWTKSPESISKVSPYTGIGPWMALPSHKWYLRRDWKNSLREDNFEGNNSDHKKLRG